jgi:HD-like signal output (HDOD) protein
MPLTLTTQESTMTVSSFLRSVLGKNSKSVGDVSTISGGAYLLVKESAHISQELSNEKFHQFLFAGSQNQPLTVPQKLVVSVVRDSLAKKEHRLNAVPRLPTIIPKLLRSLRDPDSSVRDYVTIVNKDPVMAAAVLKLANSVYFNHTGAYIGDMERAIVKLGIDGLRSVLSAAVMQPIIQRESPYFSQTGQRLWLHSLNTAVACEIIGHARRMERFKAYLLGLVHDVGKITLFSELCKQYKLNGDTSPGSLAFIPPLQQYASQLSCTIAKDWQLPEEICIALQEQIDIKPGKNVSSFGQLLYQTNIVCEAFAYTPRSKLNELQFLLADFTLPKNLFTKLEEVGTQI